MSGAPGYRPISLETNSFEITKLPIHEYYQYDVIIPQDVRPGKESTPPPRRKKIQLLHHLQTTVAPGIFRMSILYDGQAIAYSPILIPFSGGIGSAGTFVVHLNSPTVVAPGTRGSYQIRLSATIGERINPRHVDDLIRNRQSSPRSLVATNLIQLVVRQGPNKEFRTNNGRAYFSGRTNETKDTFRGILLWRGIFQSVRPTIGKMVLTMDTCAAAVFKDGPLIDVCLSVLFYNSRQKPDIRMLALRPHDANFKRLERFLKGVRITIELGNGKSRTKTIRSLVPAAGEYAFIKNESEETTVQRHFADAYNIRIRYPSIVGVNLSGPNSSRQEVVPAELCKVEKGQLCKRIPDEMRTDMVKFSTMRPDDRRKRIVDEIHRYINSEYLKESGMTVDQTPIRINAKLLNAPGVVFGDNDRPTARILAISSCNLFTIPQMPRTGAWNVVRRRLKEPQPLVCWGLVNFCDKDFTPDRCRQMMLTLTNCCSALGMGVNEPVMSNGNGYAPEQSLDDVKKRVEYKASQENIAPNFVKNLLIIIILPTDAGPLRTRVKHWGDVHTGALTQCLRQSKVDTANDQYWNNIALKLNARLGGCNFRADAPIMQQLLKDQGPFIIMGADVSHPGPGVQKPSVTSLVYSRDMHATEYATFTGIQSPRLEIIQDLKQFVYNALDAFGAKWKTSPMRLFFFRDGVSEGEYEKVAAEEIQAMQDAIRELWKVRQVKLPPPLITFVVVTKRHHAVFFGTSQEMKDPKTGNIPPGCVIDSEITHPVVNDFYLQSHAAIQGTCRSSHYVVLRDDNFGMNLSKIQQLAYALCHVYAKATRAVSIPAPVYYADLVCSRGLFHMDPAANLQFDDSVSTTSTTSNQFDLSVWTNAFRKTHALMSTKMYFL